MKVSINSLYMNLRPVDQLIPQKLFNFEKYNLKLLNYSYFTKSYIFVQYEIFFVDNFKPYKSESLKQKTSVFFFFLILKA